MSTSLLKKGTRNGRPRGKKKPATKDKKKQQRAKEIAVDTSSLSASSDYSLESDKSDYSESSGSLSRRERMSPLVGMTGNSSVMPYKSRTEDVFSCLPQQALDLIWGYLSNASPLHVARCLYVVSTTFRMRTYYFYKLNPCCPGKTTRFFDCWAVCICFRFRKHIFDTGRMIMALQGKVVDLTSFGNSHPGGQAVLLNARCIDASKRFHEVKHSVAAHRILEKHNGYLADSKMLMRNLRRSAGVDASAMLKILPKYADDHASTKFVSLVLKHISVEMEKQFNSALGMFKG